MPAQPLENLASCERMQFALQFSSYEMYRLKPFLQSVGIKVCLNFSVVVGILTVNESPLSALLFPPFKWVPKVVLSLKGRGVKHLLYSGHPEGEKHWCLQMKQHLLDLSVNEFYSKVVFFFFLVRICFAPNQIVLFKSASILNLLSSLQICS